MPLPTGKADLWLRKDITEITDPETGDISYSADEAFMRTDVSEAEVRADFDGYFDIAAAWIPPVAEDEPSSPSDLTSLESDIAALRDELEAAKIILGVE